MNFNDLIEKLNSTHQNLYGAVAKSVNVSMTIRNWLFGHYIVEYEQNGEDRAKYGENLIDNLSKRLSKEIKGISSTNLRLFRQFYQVYPQVSTLLPSLLPKITSGLIHQALPDKSASDPKNSIRQALPGKFKKKRACKKQALKSFT